MQLRNLGLTPPCPALQLVVVHALLESEELHSWGQNVVLRVLEVRRDMMIRYGRQVRFARAYRGGHAARNGDVAFADIEIQVEQRFAASNLHVGNAVGVQRIPQACAQSRKCQLIGGLE